jgi:LmbE family N-acetylglucosaminyl deacetylase
VIGDRLRVLLHSVVHMRARDLTPEVAGRNALIIAPHPDDETLGCGATILHKLAAGARVNLLVVTDGRHSHDAMTPELQANLRRTELDEAARRLGLPETAIHWGGLVDGSVEAEENELAEIIGTLIRDLRPDEVYVTCADDPHPDHAAAGRAARLACAEAGVALAEYPIWLWAAWPLRKGRRLGSVVEVFRRRVFRVGLASFAAAKEHALLAHASQLQRPADVPSDQQWNTLPSSMVRRALSRPEIFFRYLALNVLLECLADGILAI